MQWGGGRGYYPLQQLTRVVYTSFLLSIIAYTCMFKLVHAYTIQFRFLWYCKVVSILVGKVLVVQSFRVVIKSVMDQV